MDANERRKVNRSIAEGNLESWRKNGVVKSIKIYSAEDRDLCKTCAEHKGKILPVEEGAVGISLPPFDTCTNDYCRCYFRPEKISTE